SCLRSTLTGHSVLIPVDRRGHGCSTALNCRRSYRMKAEERKHLEKNELLDRLTQWWKEFRSGESKPSHTFWLVTGGIALLALLVVGWRYYADSAQKQRSNLLAELDRATTPGQLEEIADKNKGTPVGRAAKVQLARVTL